MISEQQRIDTIKNDVISIVDDCLKLIRKKFKLEEVKAIELYWGDCRNNKNTIFQELNIKIRYSIDGKKTTINTSREASFAIDDDKFRAFEKSYYIGELIEKLSPYFPKASIYKPYVEE